MNPEPQPNPSAGFPLIPGLKPHVYRMGTQPVSPFVPAPAGNGRGDSPSARPEFAIRWENTPLRLTAQVRERENGCLFAEVFCANPALLNRAAALVGLGGKTENLPRCKAIPLTVSEQGGCSGVADLGPLEDVVKELGPELALIVFLLLEPGAENSL
jgi:hypothetical protein